MKISKKLLWAVLFVYLVILFLPKANFFYLLEEELNKQHIVLNDEKLTDLFGVFKVSDAKVYYEGLHVGNIESINVLPAIIYNQVSINEAKFTNSLRQFVPKEIKNITVKGTVFYPVRFWISGDGNFGEINGYIDIYKKRLELKLKPQKNFLSKYPEIARSFKKNKQGEYIYAKNFK